MLIYVIPNIAPGKITYVCDSQETIDARPKNKKNEYIIPSEQCILGSQTDADNLLATNQQEWLTQQSSLFVVNLQTAVEGGVIWTVVDLKTEPANDDRQYFIFDPTDGLYEPAVGLDAANALFGQVQQEYLAFTNMINYQTWSEWPQSETPKNI